MTEQRRIAIAQAFGKAAERYEEHAAVQQHVAERLAERIARLPLPPRPRVLEIGCGTGYLSRALRRRMEAAEWLLTDLSSAMVARCRTELGHPADARFLVMDGEQPCAAPLGGFDLICSSLAFQWFQQPAATLEHWSRLLAPGGHIAFATMAADSFQEWRRAHEALGLEAGVPAYPSARALARLWPANGRAVIEEEKLLRHHTDGLAFLEGLKGIGAHLPCEAHRPLQAGSLRKVLRRLASPDGFTVTYHLAYGLFRREEGKPRGVFVTGTDTGVGKTLVSACLVRAWNAAYWKPLQTGLAEEAGDTATVADLAGLPPERLHPPAYALAAPLAPLAAAEREGLSIALDRLNLPPDDRPLVVEGAGGLMVPITEDAMIVDLIARFGLPVVLVARSTLGTINHTLLSLEALRARGLPVAGVILNGPPNPGNRAAIERFGNIRVLAEIPEIPAPDAQRLADVAAGIPSFEAVLSWP